MAGYAKCQTFNIITQQFTQVLFSMQKIQDKRISLRVSNQLLHNIAETRGNNKSDKIKRILMAGLANKSIDNCDYSDVVEALFELKKEIAPIGGNLNQLALYFNTGNNDNNIGNIEALAELRAKFKEWMKITKYIERKLKQK